MIQELIQGLIQEIIQGMIQLPGADLARLPDAGSLDHLLAPDAVMIAGISTVMSCSAEARGGGLRPQ
mgnify:CR=1 FL=1